MARVSVLLPVYNGEHFVRQAVTSLLDQTYSDFEIIVVDDGSTNDCLSYLDSLEDSRIRIFKNETNFGLPFTLNRARELSSGELLARQDQDDFSDPRRLQIQVDFLDENPEVGLLGTWSTIIGKRADDWVVVGSHTHPIRDSMLRWRLLWNNPFVHSSMMMRRTAFDSAGGYPTEPGESFPEDYDLWSRISLQCQMANIPLLLQHYRESEGGLSRVRTTDLMDGVTRISARNLGYALERLPEDSDVQDLARALNAQPQSGRNSTGVIRQALLLNRAARAIPDFFGPKARREVLAQQARLVARSLSRA